MADPRVPLWANARNLGSQSRPPIVDDDEDGVLVEWGSLMSVPIKPDPDWYPPGGWPRQDGDTTEPESQESDIGTEGFASLDYFVD